MKYLTVLFLISLSLLNEVRSGAACFAFCCPICTAMGPGKFCAGFGIALDITGCAAACMVACASGMIVPPACFSDDTYLYVLQDEKIISKEILKIKKNDIVATLENGKKTFTKVIDNIREEGKFQFYEFEFKCQNEMINHLKVTSDHGLITIDNFSKINKVKLASNIKLGELVYSKNGICKITNISTYYLDHKNTLITQEGTVIASDIYVSTICENEIDENKSFEEIIEYWKNKHNYI